MSDTVFVAIDIEKTGSYLIQNPIISVGFFIGDIEGKTISSHKFNIAVRWPIYINDDSEIESYGDFERRCWVEFWSKLDKKILNKCLQNPTPEKPEIVWQNISRFLNELEEKYPDKKIKFLTDNASFDIASIDYALEKYCGRAPMRYSSTGKYRSVISADDMFDMLPNLIQDKYKKEIDEIVIHDHDPVHDAQFIYLQYVYAMRYYKLMNLMMRG